MKRKKPIIDTILILILFTLLGWGGWSWLQPKYPSTVKGEDIRPDHRVLEVPTMARKAYSNSVVEKVTRLNLFRKERKKYAHPKPPKPQPKPKVQPPRPQVAKVPPIPPRPVAPLPQLILTGVVLLNGKQVAIFDGTFSEVRGGKLVQDLKPRRRGYKVGETLGEYKIESIQKTHATLIKTGGQSLTLKVSKSSPNDKIQKTGLQLTQKSKAVPVLNPPIQRPFKNPSPRPIPTRPSRAIPGAPPSAQPPNPRGTGGVTSAPPNLPPAQPPQPLRPNSTGF